jgi:hypothetical protein
MKRKEVVVGNQVFDLGLKGLEESVANRDGKLPMLELEVGEQIFQIGYIVEEKAVTLNWWGITNFPNIVWTRFVFLRLKWPFVRKLECFTYAVEGA